MPSLLVRFCFYLSVAGIFGGAGLILAGALGPWAQVVLFKNIDVSLPGFLFVGGGLCLAVAALVLLGGRHLPLLCLAGALLVLTWTQAARQDVPRRVKRQALGAQMAFFPVNRLLNQFHIGDIEVGGWGVPDDALLGSGLIWAERGGMLLLLGSALGLPRDPAVRWVSARTIRARCRACRARWLRARDAAFCPDCGIPTDSRPHCPACGVIPAPGDRHCVACGKALPMDMGRNARQ